MIEQPSASVLAMKRYEERMKNYCSMDSETSPALIAANRMALLKSATKVSNVQHTTAGIDAHAQRSQSYVDVEKLDRCLICLNA
ncbi:hypothetical protein U1Q18_021028 [Sarracenia purpurea var. burkii]